MQSGNASHLAESLKDQTRHLHTEVERTGVMRELLRGRIDRARYCLLLRNLHAIYASLEQGLAGHEAHPYLACLPLARLARAEPLADDLRVLHGPRWAQDLELLPAAHAYAQRLAALDREAPAALLAHAYVRYLGDLSGGQILRGIVSKSLGLSGETGTHFYAFGAPGEAQSLALRFRAGLDAIDIDDPAIGRIATEAQWGFACHGQLFREIGPPERMSPDA
jgi:heme oxygenase